MGDDIAGMWRGFMPRPKQDNCIGPCPMFIATLLTDPSTPALDRETVESLRNAWGGGDATYDWHA